MKRVGLLLLCVVVLLPSICSFSLAPPSTRKPACGVTAIAVDSWPPTKVAQVAQAADSVIRRAGRCDHTVRSMSSSEEVNAPIEDSTEPAVATSPRKEIKCPDCDLCDGSGRILGGIGVLLPWWPIKAYRPCPNFIDRGGIYERSGQGLDEIAFGRDSTFDPGQ